MRRFHFSVAIIYFILEFLLISKLISDNEPLFTIFGFNVALLDPLIAISVLYFAKYLFQRGAQENQENRVVLLVLASYALFQILVVLPLSHLYLGLSAKNLMRGLSSRLAILTIPYFYYCVVDADRKIALLTWFVSAMTVLLVITKMISLPEARDEALVTDTGQLRYFWGGADIAFGFLFAIAAFAQRLRPRNFILIAVAATGFILVNHRSGYLALVFMILLALVVLKGSKGFSRFGLLALSLGAMILFCYVFAPAFFQNFVGRMLTSLDADSPNARIRILDYGAGLEYIRTHLLFGGLLGNPYVDRGLFLAPIHNFLLDIAVREGLIGLLFQMAFWTLIVKISLRNRQDILTFQMMLAVAFYLFFSLFNTNYMNSWNILFLAFPTAVILRRNRVPNQYASALV